MSWGNLFKFIMVFIFCVSAMDSYAQFFYYRAPKSKKTGYIVASQMAFSDVMSSSGDTKTARTPGTDVELGFKIFHTFNFLLRSGQASDGSWSYAGFGGRINLPGFFFFGGSSRDLISESKRKPLNTSVSFSLNQTSFTENEDGRTSGYENKLGFNIELFMFSPIYINVGFNINNDLGDYYLGTATGLGFEF